MARRLTVNCSSMPPPLHWPPSQAVEDKTAVERSQALTIRDLEARLAKIDTERTAILSRSIQNLRYAVLTLPARVCVTPRRPFLQDI